MVEIEEVVEVVEEEEEVYGRRNSKAASIMLPGFDCLLDSTWGVHAYLACYNAASFQCIGP